MSNESEIWKTIENFPDYKISSFGRIKSFKFDKINGKILAKIKNNRQYFCIGLYKNNKKSLKNIHVLVYETFYDDKLKSNECVHHKDENKKNNYYKNLKKMTKPEHHSFHMKGEKHPLFGKYHTNETKNKMCENHYNVNGENNPSHKLEEWKVKAIYQISNSPIIKQLKITQKEIGEVFGVNQRTISYIKIGRNWSYLNGK